MEVILKEDVANLGHRGDVVKVAEGYGRNFLLPRKLALQATASNKAVVEQMKAAAVRRSASEKALAETLAAQLEPLTLAFTRKSGENGHPLARLPLRISLTSSRPGALKSTAARFSWSSRSRPLASPRLPSSCTAKSPPMSR